MKDATYFERAIRELQEAADNSRRESDPEAALCHITHSAWAVLGDLMPANAPARRTRPRGRT
jgi:hypothetical protein